MPSNFDSNATDLEDIFAPRSWFKLGPALFVWGNGGAGSYGALGLNDTVHRSSPTQVGALTNWQSILTGVNLNTLAIKTDGTMWTWGYNSIFGSLGLNSNSAAGSRSSPVQIGAGSDWKSISTSYSSLAIKTTGTLWSWGGDRGGVLGLNISGGTSHRSSPTQIGASTDWKNISIGSYHALATKINGTLWSWGFGIATVSEGALGLNDSIGRSSPTQVGTSTDWTNNSIVASNRMSSLIRGDGTLWTFGAGPFGSLGLNSIVYRSSPTQVGTLSDWRNISHSSSHALATKTDNTLWSWGYGDSGGLGLNSTINRSSPVQVGTLSNWRSTSNSFKSSFAIKTDGTLWAWGFTISNGTLGLNNNISRSSPVQVGTQTNWRSVSAGGGSTAATLDFTSI